MIATYRLQMNADFTFADAARLVDYFRELGVSHLYLSPIWQALPGSGHGYDVIDHARINDELGGYEGFAAFSNLAHRAGLRIIADIVPNHAAIAGHHWWRDVLRLGRESPYAEYFDIDWGGRGGLPPGRLLLPVLNEPLEHAIQGGDLKIRLEDGEPAIDYRGQSLPLSPESRTAAIAVLEEQRIQLRPLESLLQLLAAQHYQMAEWRLAPRLINYRRFFDVNGLAGLRMEHRPAFEDTHRLVAQLAAEGHIDGLRVDHVDGLYDPAAYLRDLSELCPGVPVWVEKILAEDESLPPWPVVGTTGYEFPAAVETLFYDPTGHERLFEGYRSFTGRRDGFAGVAFDSRQQVARDAFEGDIGALAADFHVLAEGLGRARGISIDDLQEALLALLACFPRYRTYSDASGPSEEDRSVVQQAAAAAKARAVHVGGPALDFIVDVLSDSTAGADQAERPRRRALVSRFQQLSSPIMAKGIEDTAFYRYTPLLCENEVGGTPGSAAHPPERVHAWLASRVNQPLTLNATSTHDTKRSEDARMRLAVLTEIPAEWNAAVASWAHLNFEAKGILGGEVFPTAHTEHYLYQSLVASWDGSDTSDYVERIVTHMRKASREGKLWTSWLEPNEAREAALESFVRTILDGAAGSGFRAHLGTFFERIQAGAESNSLALLALKCLAPGLPDFYQGAEDWLHTLTDPDNRRPVDYEALSERLRNDEPRSAKNHLARQLLQLRAGHPELFSDGSYEAVQLCGPIAEHAFAFLRQRDQERVAVMIRRRVAGLLDSGAQPFRDLARESSIRITGADWFDWLLTGRITDVADVLTLLADRPVVVLTNFERPAA